MFLKRHHVDLAVSLSGWQLADTVFERLQELSEVFRAQAGLNGCSNDCELDQTYEYEETWLKKANRRKIFWFFLPTSSCLDRGLNTLSSVIWLPNQVRV